MDAPDIFNAPERLCETARYRDLARLDAYFRGNQYDGRADWYTGETGNGERVPLRERKPCIIYPLPRAAVNEVVRFAIGEGRFPTLEVEDLEPEEALREDLAVSEEDAASLTAFIASLVRCSHLKSSARQMMRRGLACKTAPVILAIRRGQFVLDLPRPQDCFPTFRDGDPTADVERMVWCYPFPKEVEEAGQIVSKIHYFRRDITGQGFIVYRDALAEYGKGIKWEVDAEATAKAQHNFGFCPVVWIRNLPESHCGDIDGVGPYDGLEDEFDALNFALSQQHRGINYFGTPQAYETDVADDERPAATVRTARPVRELDPAKSGPFGVNPKKARALAPDEIWSYSGPAKLGVLETSGKAFEVASKHIMSVRARIMEALSVILIDPETAMQRDLAGIALQRLYAPMFAFVDELREHWWEHGFAKILSMMLRCVAVRGGEGLLIPGAVKVAPMLKRYMVDTTEGPLWMPPSITPTWGDYMSPSPADVKIAVETADKAKAGGLVTGETATAYVAPYFGVDDPEKEAEDAEDDAEEAAHKALAEAGKTANEKAKTTPPNEQEPREDSAGQDPAEVETPPPSGRGATA